MSSTPLTPIQCPFCNVWLRENAENCTVCGENLIIGVLVCTQPLGDVKAGDSWTLYPRDYTIGRSEFTDIVIVDEYVSREHHQLVFRDGAFHIRTLSKNREPGEEQFRKLEQGDAIPIANGRLSLHYIKNFEQYSETTQDAFKVALATICMFQRMSDTAEISDLMVDAVLRITGLQKGYLFAIAEEENEYKLNPWSARTATGQELGDKFYPISQSFCEKIVDANGKILIIDTETSTEVTDSVARFNLESIICCPLLDQLGNLVGLIYADSQDRIQRNNLFFFRPVLRMLCNVLMHHLAHLNPEKPL